LEIWVFATVVAVVVAVVVDVVCKRRLGIMLGGGGGGMELSQFSGPDRK